MSYEFDNISLSYGKWIDNLKATVYARAKKGYELVNIIPVKEPSSSDEDVLLLIFWYKDSGPCPMQPATLKQLDLT